MYDRIRYYCMCHRLWCEDIIDTTAEKWLIWGEKITKNYKCTIISCTHHMVCYPSNYGAACYWMTCYSLTLLSTVNTTVAQEQIRSPLNPLLEWPEPRLQSILLPFPYSSTKVTLNYCLLLTLTNPTKIPTVLTATTVSTFTVITG